VARASLTDPIVASARRILLIGVTGSGKSTLARALEARHGIPAVDVDALAWRGGWVKAPEAEFVAEVGEIVAGDAWVLDSAWTAIRPVVLPRTDVVVALDLPRHVSLGRLVGRTLRRVVTRERVCGDNVETLRQVLSGDSIIAWHFRSFGSKRRLMDEWESDPLRPPVLRLTTPAQVAEFLDRPR
jgi:adenylate kinase family enzyme